MTTWNRNETNQLRRECTLDVSSLADGSFAPTNTSLAGKLQYRAGGTTFAAAGGTLTNTGFAGKWLYQAPQGESDVDATEIEYLIVDTTWYAQTLVEIRQPNAAPASPPLAPGGPNYLVGDLIARARAYIGDDHDETPGWTSDATWINWLNAEYGILYRRWVRNGLVRPKPTESTFQAAVTLSGVLCVVGVADTMSPGLGGGVRVLEPAQVQHGADPFWSSASNPFPHRATSWAVHGISDELTIEIDPPDTATTYTVRWIPAPGAAAVVTDQLALPSGGDERLVLGTARRATVKDGARLSLLEQLLTEQDAEETFVATARAGGFAARRKPHHRRGRFSDNPRDWYFY